MEPIAEMDPALRGIQPRPIPLECVLCPKKPSFSDISHLLTHVSSKSHFHHKFNMEFQAKTDADASDILTRYLNWYDVNGIEVLLADRLSSKEQKKTGRRGRPRNSTTAARPPTQQPVAIKTDPDDVFTDANTLPPVGVWNTSATRRSLRLSDARQGAPLDDSAYRTPSARRIRSPFLPVDSPNDPFQVKYERSRSTTETSDSFVASEVTTAVATEVADDEGNASKLKGVIWPGMNLFDSATPDQKRKRNQRKDSSVLEHMKLTSQAVTPTECIWGVDGEYQRCRDIYASPSIDGSPVAKTARKKRARSPPDSPTKSRRGRQPKAKKAGPSGAASKRRRQPLADVTTTRQTRASARAAGQRQDLVSVKTDTEDEDASHNIKREEPVSGPRRRRTRAALDAFKEEPTTHSPGRTESPTEDNRFDLAPRTTLQPINPSLLLASPTPLSRHAPLRFYSSAMEASILGYRQHAAPYSQHYLSSGHTMSPSISEGLGFNPLYAQARMGFSPYQSYNSPLFDDGTKDTAVGLQTHTHRLDYGSFSLSQPSNPYASSTQRPTTDFDI